MEVKGLLSSSEHRHPDEVFQRATCSLRLGRAVTRRRPGAEPAGPIAGQRCSAGQADISRTDPGPLGQPKSTAAEAWVLASTSAHEKTL